MFAVYTSLDKKNIGKAIKIIFNQFKRLQNLKDQDLEEAKTYIEGNYVIQMEDNFHFADNLATWESIKDAKLTDSYIKNIRKVTINDVKKVSKKFLNDKYTLVVIEQK